MTMNLALVGCGGMGLRHLYGLIELRKHFDTFHLAAVCDVYEPAAQHVASVAAEELGDHPTVYTDFADLLRAQTDLDAVDIVTDTRMHHVFAEMAFEAGVHVTVEKPMGLTLKACRRMAAAAEASGKTLSIAENYRRDPLCRLARALLEAGAIGTPRFVLDVSVGGGDTLMHNTAWRALKNRGGGFVIEQGVHIADLLLYYLGDAGRVFAETGVFEPVLYRRPRPPRLDRYYQHRSDVELGDVDAIEADAVDTGIAVVRFESGAICQLTMTNASRAHGVSVGTIHGSLGTMKMPGARSGRGPVLMLEGEEEPLEGDRLLELAGDFSLDEITAPFFGGPGPIASYDMPFEQVDATLVGIECQDFAQAIQTGGRPEVDSIVGMKPVALAYAVLESGEMGAPVAMSDVLEGTVAEYQRSIDEENGI